MARNHGSQIKNDAPYETWAWSARGTNVSRSNAGTRDGNLIDAICHH